MCKYKASNKAATDKGFVQIKESHDEDELTEMIAHAGPVSVAIDASQWRFQFYGGGK